MDDCVAGFLEIVNFVFVGRLNIGTDEHQFFYREVVKGLGDCLRGRQGWAAARFLNNLNDRGLMR
jgi:hypothetical protein